ncbi:CHAD domain-containing protein [Prauserella cavernicola]|uniref:CHAD domain-containing protein n=1 Tax=Prauserella cavernicola TaxID=2800127 RepID=A0A934QV82_9PSEU|nr:CHAD domain-containing protein [Prauserella cavernicola]MBK1785939.1 CHAD domain-containing protein [Prauserella cavernicola]
MPKVSQPLTLRWHGEPARGEEQAVLAALAPAKADRYELAVGPRRTRTVTYLDTVDWRLHAKGIVLSHERASGPGTLTVDGRGEENSTRLTESPQWPARVEQLPEGEVRDGVAAAMWVRAVAPVVRARVVSREVAVLDDERKTVVRLDWVELTGTEPSATRPLVRVTLRPVLGYGGAAKRVRKALEACGDFAEIEDGGAYATLLEAEGIAPEESAPPAISADMPADVAVATALHGFAGVIAVNVDGVLDDIDTEFLHDLRVAVRRTRSLLKLAGDVLPPELVRRYGSGFKWLGDATTPTRDLDVYLLEFDTLAAGLVAGEPGDLAPFGELLASEREKARRALARTLRSQRFTRLIEGWQAGLADVLERDWSEQDGRLTAEALAAERVRGMVAKVIKRAKAITPDSPAEDVHRLRKRCKELRYLLEVVKPVCDATAHRAVIKDLKKVQDVLGAFQDGEVQSHSLRDYAERLQSSGRPPAATLLAMGELSASFVTMQRQARHDLTGALRKFLGPATHERIEDLLP